MKLKLFTTEREASLEETRRFWNEGVGVEAEDWRLELSKNGQEIEVWHTNAETGVGEVVEYFQAPIGEAIDEFGWVDIDGDGDLDLMFGNWQAHFVAFSQEAQISKLKHQIEKDPDGETPTGFWAGQFLGALEQPEQSTERFILEPKKMNNPDITAVSQPVESPEDVQLLNSALRKLEDYDLSDQKPLLEILVALYEGTIYYFTRPENEKAWESTRREIEALLATQNPDWWAPKLLEPIIDNILWREQWSEVLEKVNFAKYPESYLKFLRGVLSLKRYYGDSIKQFFPEPFVDQIPAAQKMLTKVIMDGKASSALEIIEYGRPDRWKNSEELFEAINRALDLAVVEDIIPARMSTRLYEKDIDAAIDILLKMHQRLPDYLIERLGGSFEELDRPPFSISVGKLLDLLSRQNLEPDDETRKIVEDFLKKFPYMAKYFYGTEEKSERQDRQLLLRTVEAFCNGDVVAIREAAEEFFGISVEIFLEMSNSVNPAIYERRAKNHKICSDELPKAFEEIFLK